MSGNNKDLVPRRKSRPRLVSSAVVHVDFRHFNVVAKLENTSLTEFVHGRSKTQLHVNINPHVHATLHHHYTHTHPFNGSLSRTTRVSQYQKGKTNLDFTEARDSEWQWQQLGYMQVCTSIQTDNHANTPPLSFYRPDALPAI